jgi:hypothetical protein
MPRERIVSGSSPALILCFPRWCLLETCIPAVSQEQVLRVVLVPNRDDLHVIQGFRDPIVVSAVSRLGGDKEV